MTIRFLETIDKRVNYLVTNFQIESFHLGRPFGLYAETGRNCICITKASAYPWPRSNVNNFPTVPWFYDREDDLESWQRDLSIDISLVCWFLLDQRENTDEVDLSADPIYNEQPQRNDHNY